MATQESETSNGWPLGLQIMNMQLQVIQDAPAEPYSNLRLRSPSFSSFSSSNLDTESTASFFQDRSVSLGRLIGIRQGKGEMYFTRRIQLDEGERECGRTVRSEECSTETPEMSAGICIPLLEKMSRSKSKAKRDTFNF